MSGKFIDIESHDGQRFSAYLAVPKQGSGPGLVLLQEIFGINGYMKAMADQFAEEGYVVLVPDLFWRIKRGVCLGYDGDDLAIALLRKVMGPVYDLNSLWDLHCYYEFATRDVDAILPTMVAQPYVNHVPTMTGGVGHDQLKRFYKYHFVNANPADTRLIPLSRTIGADRIVDEFVFCATHDVEIDWLLPGLEPTGKYFEIPMLAVVCFRGDKLYNEHIYWDQASVLVQIGVLDPKGLPIAGIETAKKMVNERLPSNTLMRNWASSEGKPV